VIVFAKTRYHYDSYIDFWKLVELSGFSTCYVDEIDLASDDCYIFTPMNGEVIPHLRNESSKTKKATVIWWCLERFDAMAAPLPDILAEATPHVDRIWVSDAWTSTLHPALEYMRMGSHPDLGGLPRAPVYDFTHQSYAWGRRKTMYQKLKNSGFSEGPSSWGDERHGVLQTSRLMLNLQQYTDPVSAPLRFALAAAYRLPIVSETITDADILTGVIPSVPYSAIPGAIQATLDSPGDVGAKVFQLLCEDWTFQRCVTDAI
jgi:hypothetical protein